MFNFARRIRERQLKKAALVQNFVMLGIFGYWRKILNAEVPSTGELDRIIAAAINQIFGKSGDANNFSEEELRQCQKLTEAILSDASTDKLILRILFDLFTLNMELGNAAAILSEYPAIVDVLDQGKKRHPDVFQDWKEHRFKELLERFASKYDPEKRNNLAKLFS